MALPDFPIDKSYLIAAWLSSAFWGAFTVVFACCMVSVFMVSNRNRNMVTTSAVVIMYILCTVHISLVLARIIQAFIVHVHDDGGAVSYLADVGQPLNKAKDMVYVSLIFVGDLILVWRCLMVWNQNYYVIAIPVITVLGTAISGYGSISNYFLPSLDTPVAIEWAQGMLATSMVTNLLVTGLTAGRIWWLSCKVGGLGLTASKTRYFPLILLLIESGAAITVSKTLELILFELAPDDGLDGFNALYVVMDCVPQIMGLAPTVIILAVNRGLTPTGPYTSSSFASETGGYYGSRPFQAAIAFSEPTPNSTMQFDVSLSFMSHATTKEDNA